MRSIFTLALFATLAALCGPDAFAQDPQVTGDQDGSSQQVEESDEAYRRRMELEDARHRDPTYTDPGGTYQRDLEKIDKLPQESRENIRDQLVDIIMENSDWQPGDALEEYPYEPTEAAQANADLMNQEQEAWDEQIEKYHAREAAAFGAYRGPVEGPGNPDGQEGGSEGGQQGSQGGQQGGQDGSEGNQGTAGTYQPYQSQNSSSENSDSTDGVSESALDFLMSRQASQGQAGSQSQEQQASNSSTSQSQQQQSQQDSSQQSAQQQAQEQEQSQQEQADNAEDSDEQVTETDMRGIIAIEDLDKLEGAFPVVVEPPEEEKQEENDP